LIITITVLAWFSWILPTLQSREPAEFVTDVGTSGRITKLTYQASASNPVISPDGKYIIYYQGTIFKKKLFVMDANGKNKRAVGEQQNLTVANSFPLAGIAWSPDSKSIITFGTDKDFHITNPSEERPADDLWLIELTSGTARKIIDAEGRGFLSAKFVPDTDKIIITVAEKDEAYLWIADRDGNNQKKITDVKSANRYITGYPWHAGKDVIICGNEDAPGIWSIDVNNAKATCIADIDAYRVSPLDEDRLVITQQVEAYPPGDKASSIGILHLNNNEVEWLIKNFQAFISPDKLLNDNNLLVFKTREHEINTIYTLSLEDGSYKFLDSVHWGLGYDISPDGKWMVYADTKHEDSDKWELYDQSYIWREDFRQPIF